MTLDCPESDCGERFHDSHDESAVSSLLYHIGQKHPELYMALKSKLRGYE